MPRTKVDYRTGGIPAYKDFKKKNPDYKKMTYKEWSLVIYAFNEEYMHHILETGDKEKLPYGMGQFSIIKKKRKKTTNYNGVERINLPIDWKRTHETGKTIYNFNYHTEGYFFGWYWFKDSARFRFHDLWYFKPCRVTSRTLAKYIFKDQKYQHTYKVWKT